MSCFKFKQLKIAWRQKNTLEFIEGLRQLQKSLWHFERPILIQFNADILSKTKLSLEIEEREHYLGRNNFKIAIFRGLNNAKVRGIWSRRIDLLFDSII